MEATLEAVRREGFGKNEAGRLRRSGRIPAVLYGGNDRKAESVAVDPKALMHILHSQGGTNTLIALKIDGADDTRVLVKEFQLDPVGHKLLHADFYRVAMDRVLQVTIPVRLTGEAKTAKALGGMVDFVHRELVIECLPANIPEHITVDVTDLMINQGVRVRDLPTDGTWTAVSEPDTLIVHVVSPKAEVEPVAADAAAAAPVAAEPEVIKKGKVEKADEPEEKKK